MFDFKASVFTEIPELAHLRGLKQNPRYHRFDAWDHTLAVVNKVPSSQVLFWAALLHDVAKGLPGVRCLNKWGEVADHGHAKVGAEMATEIMSRLCMGQVLIQRVSWLIREHMNLPEANEKAVQHWVNRLSKDFSKMSNFAPAVIQLLELRKADTLAGLADPDMSGLTNLISVIQHLPGISRDNPLDIETALKLRVIDITLKRLNISDDLDIDLSFIDSAISSLDNTKGLSGEEIMQILVDSFFIGGDYEEESGEYWVRS